MDVKKKYYKSKLEQNKPDGIIKNKRIVENEKNIFDNWLFMSFEVNSSDDLVETNNL